MADIYKTKEIETNINERGVNLGNVDVTLYTMDKGSAAFKIYLKREVNYGNEKVYDSVNLYTTDMTPRIDIVAADGSVFSNEPVDIVIPENGVIQYIISDYVIRHAGKMDVYIYLENKSESVQVANFYFYIEEDGVARRLGKEITGDRLDDIVKNVMSGQLMELLSEDYREQLDKEIKQFLSDNNKDFNLKFEDLTRDEKDELMKNLTNQGLADFKIEDNSILNEKLVDGTIQPEKTNFFKLSTNLFNKDKAQLNKTIENGKEVTDDKRWLSGYMPVTRGEKIQFTEGSYRIAFYDKDHKFLIQTGLTNSYNTTPTAVPMAYFRVSSSVDIDTVMINKGDTLLPYEPYIESRILLKSEYVPDKTKTITTSDTDFFQKVGDKIVLKSEYVPDILNTPSESIPQPTVSKNEIVKLINKNVEVYTPNIPKLKFEEIRQGYNEAFWLSEDGKRLYGHIGPTLWVSYDEGETLTNIITMNHYIKGVRETNDNELLISVEQDVTNHEENAKVFKTVGYNKNDGTLESTKKVIETPSPNAKFNNSWAFSIYENIITVSEYGLRDMTGARRAWLSKDHGDTFELVFDRPDLQNKIGNGPEWNERYHMHTTAFDPYWNRIWVVNGDAPQTSAYYSDDFGETWKFIEGSDKTQYTGIIALPNCVIFGSDRAPNGLYVYYRGNKDENPEIEPLLLINDNATLTHVFQLPYKRSWESDTPVYFSVTRADGSENKNCLVATVDGKRGFILHENNLNDKFGGNCYAYLGPTEQGNIIGTFWDTDIKGFRLAKAKAPIWTKM